MEDGNETAAPKGSQSPIPALEVPNWVPRCLHAQAVKIHARHVQRGHALHAALVRLLLTDERMKGVWQQLLKHKRDQHHTPTREFYYPARLPAAAGSTSEIQDRGLQALFFESLMFAEEPWLPGEAQHYTEIAANLRKDAAVAGEKKDRKHQGIETVLRAAASAYDEMNDLMRTGHARQLAVQIADLMQEIFGITGYRSTATIVSVALQTEITSSQVREWCRSTRMPTMGKKAKKRGAAPEYEGRGR